MPPAKCSTPSTCFSTARPSSAPISGDDDRGGDRVDVRVLPDREPAAGAQRVDQRESRSSRSRTSCDRGPDVLGLVQPLDAADPGHEAGLGPLEHDQLGRGLQEPVEVDRVGRLLLVDEVAGAVEDPVASRRSRPGRRSGWPRRPPGGSVRRSRPRPTLRSAYMAWKSLKIARCATASQPSRPSAIDSVSCMSTSRGRPREVRTRVAADQADHVVALVRQHGGDGAADEAGGAGDRDPATPSRSPSPAPAGPRAARARRRGRRRCRPRVGGADRRRPALGEVGVERRPLLAVGLR